jgi:hypothetical protein
MVRGTGAASYTYLATVYTTLGIRARPTRPTRPEGAPYGGRLGLWGPSTKIESQTILEKSKIQYTLYLFTGKLHLCSAK